LARPESPEEDALFVQFAAKIDDGEAMTLALCVSRGYAFATDDRKARRIAASVAEPISLLATSIEQHQSRQNPGGAGRR
jgi:predicted nucleic acid-binding protein